MPTITYVGRVTDSRKGLPIFGDALELLLSADLPLFRTRIIGGSAEEVESVRQTLHQTDACRESLQAGRIEVWTAVDRTALPELYSRSTVVCIPSLREQFGMVAVEAMMCGTPVVASKIGGLQDLVVHNLTGYLVDRLNPLALAAALAQFIRNPSLASWMGHNAFLLSRNRFDLDIVTRQYIKLYETIINGAEPPRNEESGLALLRQRIINTHQPTIEQLLGSSILECQDVSSGPTPSFVVKSEDGKYFVKIHQERPPSLTCLTSSEYNTSSQTIPSQRIKIAQLLSAAPVIPQIVSANEHRGILIQELLSHDVSATEQESETLMIEASKQIRSLIKIKGFQAERFLQSLQDVATMTEQERAVEIVDDATAKLSSAILGFQPYLRQCHPQIELIRLGSYLRKNAWAVRPEFGARAQSLIKFLISENSLVCTYPNLQHGSMKREHLMRRHSDGTAAVCDLDHAGLYVGPHDIAHWFYDMYARNEVAAPFHMLSQIRRLADNDNDGFLGAVWLAIFPIYDAIWRFAGGNWELKQSEMQFLTAYPEAFRKVFTQLGENAGLR